MKRPPIEVEKKVSEYLALIGHRGGVASRRELLPEDAKQMVAIREAKRELIRKGKIVEALKRQPLTRPKKKPPRRLPAVYRKQRLGTVFPRTV